MPQASDSIATSPNGSGHEPGHQHRVARREESIAVAARQLAEELDAGASGLEGRLEDVVVVGAFRGCRADLGGDPQLATAQLGDLDRLDDPLLRLDPPDETEIVG